MPKSRGRKPKKKRAPASAPKKRLDNLNATPQELPLSTQPPQEPPPLATAPRGHYPTLTRTAFGVPSWPKGRAGCSAGSKRFALVNRGVQHIRTDSLVVLSVATGKSTPSDHDNRHSATDVRGSSRWNVSPIVRFHRLRDRLVLERGTLPENGRGWGLSCRLVLARRRCNRA